jgi:hypothetical protein
MTIDYLLPLSLPSTRHVDDIAYLFKKGMIERLMLTTLDLWEIRGRRHDVFFTLKVYKLIPRHCDQQRSTTIMVEGTFLCLRSFTPFD